MAFLDIRTEVGARYAERSDRIIRDRGADDDRRDVRRDRCFERPIGANDDMIDMSIGEQFSHQSRDRVGWGRSIRRMNPPELRHCGVRTAEAARLMRCRRDQIQVHPGVALPMIQPIVDLGDHGFEARSTIGLTRLHRRRVIDHDRGQLRRPGQVGAGKRHHRQGEDEQFEEEPPGKARASAEALTAHLAQGAEREDARDDRLSRPLPGKVCQHQERQTREQVKRSGA